MTLKEVVLHTSEVCEVKCNWIIYSTTHDATLIRHMVCRVAYDSGVPTTEIANLFGKTTSTITRSIRTSYNLPPMYDALMQEIYRRVHNLPKETKAKPNTQNSLNYIQRLTSFRKTPSIGFKFTDSDYKKMCKSMENVDKFMAKYGKGEVARDAIWFGNRKYL